MKNWRRQAQLRAGDFIFRKIPPYRARLLAFWTEGGASLSPLEKWLFGGVTTALDRRYYDATTSTAERERIKGLCMTKDSAITWAKHYLSLGFPDRYTHALSMFTEIEALLASGSIQTVHQVACCSGREIAYFAQRYPEVKFVGSDFDEALILFLRDHWRHVPNLTFDLVRMDDENPTAETQACLKCDLLYASGGFHYMDLASLRRFCRQVRPLAGRLLLSQPMNRSYAVGHELASQARGLLSWNHPYPAILKEAGWTNIRLVEGFVEELPRLKNVAVFAESP